MRAREFIASMVGGVAVYVACASNPVSQTENNKTDARYTETGEETKADSPLQDILNVIDGVLPDVVVVDGPLDAKADDSGVVPPNNGEHVTSGTRIKATYTTQTTGDGAKSKLFAGWQDTQMNTPCTLTKGADGKNRCFPEDGNDKVVRYSEGSSVNQGQILFLDVECKQPVIVISSSAPQACKTVSYLVYFGSLYGATCRPSTQVVSVNKFGQPLTTSPTAWYRLGASNFCQKETSPWPYSDTSVYTVLQSTNVPLSDFAEMQIVTE